MVTSFEIQSLAGKRIPVLNAIWDGGDLPLPVPSGHVLSCGSGPDVDLCFDLPGVAPHHCDLASANGHLLVKPLESDVWVNDLPVHGRQRVFAGDHLAVGAATFRVSFEYPEATAELPPPHTFSPAVTVSDSDSHTGRGELQAERRRLQEELNLLHRETRRLEQERDRLRALQEELTASRNDLRQRDTALAEQSSSLAESARILATQAESIEKERTDWEAKRSSQEAELKAERSRLQQETEELERRRQESADNDTQIQESVRRRQQDVEQLEEQIRVRESEIAEREAALRATEAEIEQQRAQVAEELEVCRTAISRQEAELGRQQDMEQFEAQIRARESEIAEREAALRATEAEIEQQRAQVAAEIKDRRTELGNREAQLEAVEAECRKLAAQSEVIREEQQALEERRNALNLQESRLAERDQELSRRVDDAEARLAELVEQCAALTAERDELRTALHEARQAIEAARAAAESATETESDTLVARIAELEAELTACRQRLQETESRLEEVEATARQVQEDSGRERETLLEELREARTSRHEESVAAEEQLLEQVRTLQQELLAAQDQRSGADGLQDRLAKQDDLVRRLTRELDEAQQAIEELSAARDASAGEDQNVTPETEVLREQLAERDELIRDLRSSLSGLEDSTAAAAAASDADVAMRSRELDERTTLLDRREDEITERNRLIENAEEELEVERRQLQEARQQLELARAELQLSIDRGNPAPESIADITFSETESAEAVESVDPESEIRDEPTGAAHDIRGELASLFGIGGADSEEPAPSYSNEDCSTAGGDAVLMRFEDSQGVLVESDTTPDDSDSADGESGDYVTRYMEELLARNRATAGKALPQELHRPAEPPEEKPKSVSFIDRYMAEQGLDSQPEAPAAAPDPPDVPGTPEPPARQRSRIDLEALRSNMDSFRQVSVRSAQHAIESHSRKVERGGIVVRAAVLTVLLMLTLFVVAATLMDIVDSPMLLCGLLLASGAAGCELLRKLAGRSGRGRSGESSETDYATQVFAAGTAVDDSDQIAQDRKAAPHSGPQTEIQPANQATEPEGYVDPEPRQTVAAADGEPEEAQNSETPAVAELEAADTVVRQESRGAADSHDPLDEFEERYYEL